MNFSKWLKMLKPDSNSIETINKYNILNIKKTDNEISYIFNYFLQGKSGEVYRSIYTIDDLFDIYLNQLDMVMYGVRRFLAEIYCDIGYSALKIEYIPYVFRLKRLYAVFISNESLCNINLISYSFNNIIYDIIDILNKVLYNTINDDEHHLKLLNKLFEKISLNNEHRSDILYFEHRSDILYLNDFTCKELRKIHNVHNK